jgi:hypothetical protein
MGRVARKKWRKKQAAIGRQIGYNHHKMTLTIDLSPEVERRLRDEAARMGLDESEYARRVIERSLPLKAGAVDQATLDLFAEWERNDRTSDPTEIQRRNREYDELKEALNQNRRESGGANARKIFLEECR